ncbi:trypsin-like peptidase domain-containing protein [Nocardia salmonicida]|uniref:trypsin-like peptidase domain-containing protein n=1 Tax=Nocardia salmonicida TaxID=53431 RepID=UPI0010424784|nr:trypsin-like peptidase domain-containing protein [Nocardia salmonicida]
MGTTFVLVGKSNWPYFVTNRHVTDYNFNNPKPDYTAAVDSIWVNGHMQPSDLDAPTLPWRVIIEDADIHYHEDPEIDVAVIRLGAASGSFAPLEDGSIGARTMNNFNTDWLATSEELDNILPGNELHIAGYPAVNDLSGDRPLIVTGIVASDPRYPAVFATEIRPRTVLSHSFSWAGMSGAPVIAWPQRLGWGRIIGVNAGHYRSAGVASGVISHFVRSDAILDILKTLGEPDLLPGRDEPERQDQSIRPTSS